jgi:HK97 gp10 family phage protein
MEPVADRAAAMAPEETGRLAFSIAVSDRGTRRARWKRDKYNYTIAAGPAAGTGSLYYATHVEFGTVDTPAQPYMRPAWDGGQAQALQHVKDQLGNEIARAAGRIARKAAR